MALTAVPAAHADSTITGPAAGPISWSSANLTITGAGTIGSAPTGVSVTGTVGALSNSGAIIENQGGGAGILNLTGTADTIANLAGGTITGAGRGVLSDGAVGLLSNGGLITSSGAAGVANGGAIATLSNDAGGTISSSAAGSAAAGVYNSGAIGAISNSGLISGDAAYGVINAGGSIGQLNNAAGGSIFGHVTGVWNNGQIGTLSNAGSISAYSGAGVRNLVSIDLLQNSGSIGGSQGLLNNGHIGTLSNTGLIDGGTVGVANLGGTIDLLDNSGTIAFHGLVNTGAIASLSNTGLIAGGHGIDNAGTIANLTNAAGGRIQSDTSAVVNRGRIGTLSNSGLISGLNAGVATSGAAFIDVLANHATIQSDNTAVYVGSNTSISSMANKPGGVIHGAVAGVTNAGMVGFVGNEGLISSDTGHAFGNGANLGILFNEAGGTIAAAGGGTAAAVYDSGAIGTINNSGVISAPSAYGVIVTGGGVGTINNQAGGFIAAGKSAVWNNGTIGVFTNAGTITSATTVAVRNLVSIGTFDSWGVIGGGTGVRNDGTIGSLTNSGTINAGNVAIEDPGHMGTVNNAAGGFLESNIGVRVTGVLGELDNAGYIMGGSRAVTIGSGGSLGVLGNTGVIEGVIENASASDLTIAGGTGSTYGALTGSGGAQSAILNSSSDLHLSGNLVLDDAVTLGGRTLFSSANLRMTRDVNVSGNFSQDGGSLMFGVASPSNYARLLFAGPAQVNIANAGVGLIPASNGILAVGQSYTVVQAPGGAIAISNDTAQVAGFTGVLTNTGHNLVLSLLAPAPAGGTGGTGGSGGSAGGSGGSAGDSGSGFASSSQAQGGSSGVGGALDTIGNGATAPTQAFNAVVTPVIVSQTPSGQAQALTQLAPSTLGMQVGLNASTPVSDAVAGQQARFVAQAQGRAYASLGDDYYGVGSGGAERGLWGKVLGGTADGGAGSGAPFSASLGGVAIGADLLRSDEAYGGLAASWVRTWAAGKGPQAATRLSFDSYQISAYGSFAPRAYGGRLSVDAMVGVAWNRYDQERRIDFLGSAARASYNGEQYMGRLTVGYAFTGDRVTFTPYAGVEETHLVNHGYSEHGAGLADLSVAGKTADTFRHDIGVKMEGAWDLGGGRELLPSLKLGWGHTYDNGPVTLYSSLAGVTFASPAARPAADGALIGAGLVLRQAGRISVGLEYQGDLRRDFQAHTGAVRLTVKF